MRQKFTLLMLAMFLGFGVQAQDTRYIDEVFTDVDVQKDVIYGVNTTVLTVPVTGSTTKVPLFMDVYTPTGDTETERPLVLLFHTGNFLPQLVNGQISGSKEDEYAVDFAQRLVRRGYVVAMVDYRLGWNPLSDQQEVRTNTLINAAYRGVQDATTCVRFFRKSVAEENNPFGIDGEKVTIWGLGTGGYISLAASTLDQYTDILLPKFIGSDIDGNGTPDPMVILPINGDPFATEVGRNPLNGDTLCFPNHVGFSSEFQLTVNVGGALGDTSWLDAGDNPILSFQTTKDPFAPYEEGILTVPTTGDLVVEVQGAKVLQEKATALGVNDILNDKTLFDDPITARANEINDGNPGLFPVIRPTWDLDGDGTPETEESGPWEWWDVDFWSELQPEQCADNMIPLEQCNWDLLSRANNPDMTFAKADAYIDTIMQFFAPRACVVLDLPCASLFSGVENVNLDASIFTIAPNPISEQATISSDEIIEAFEVYGLDGRKYQTRTSVNSTSAVIERNNMPQGVYIVKAYFEEGVASKRVIFN